MAGDGFLNVDLELGAKTRTQLAPLIEALDGKLFELFTGRMGALYRAHYESTSCHADANATLDTLVGIIEGLDGPARRAWSAAAMRDFNIGLELARGVKSIELAIDPALVARVAALDARIAFTAYQEVAILSAMKKKRATARSAASRRAARRPAR